MIVNLTRGAKTASLHLPADRFQIAGVLSYLGVDRLDDYDLPCEGQDSSGIMVSLEPTGIAERNIAELCRNEKISLGRLNSGFRSLFKLPYEQQLGVMDRIANQKPEHFDDFRKTIDAATVPSVRQEYYFPITVNLYTANRWGDYDITLRGGEEHRVTVRSWKGSDRMAAERGSRSLKRLFADAGIGIETRDSVPVVCVDGQPRAVYGVQERSSPEDGEPIQIIINKRENHKEDTGNG